MKRLLLLLSIGVCLSGCAEKVSSIGREQPPVFKLSKQEKKEGYQVLFDGTSLAGWIDQGDQYRVDEGTIVKKSSGYGNLYSKNEYKDFILRFEFLLTPGANNGLGIRQKLVEGRKGYDGMELQILDHNAPVYKNLKPYQYHGSLYGYVPAKRSGLKPAGQWNFQEVQVRGSKITVILNGETILDTNIRDLPAAALAKDPRLLYEKGHLAFLGHDSEVRFCKIRIRELK